MCLNVKLDSLSCHLHPYHILVIYHQIFSMNNSKGATSEEGINCFPLEHTRNTTGATSEVGTFFPQEHICSLQYCVRFMLLNHSVCYCIVFCRAMFVFSSFLFWSLYCLFFDFWLLITFSGCFKHFLII